MEYYNGKSLESQSISVHTSTDSVQIDKQRTADASQSPGGQLL